MRDLGPIAGIVAGRAEGARAAAWAQRLGLPLLEARPDDALVFVLEENGLGLVSTAPRAPGPVRVDFAALDYRRRGGSLRKEAVARAVGLRGNRSLDIVDATAGLGTDAFILAALGARARMIECAPAVAALLEDGLKRAAADPALAPIAARMELHRGDALDLLPALAAARPIDAVYLDPMYPKEGTKGQVKKEMQILRHLLGPESEPAALLNRALEVAPRVVVKRPRRAPPVAGRPSHSLEGRSTRFDIYLRP